MSNSLASETKEGLLPSKASASRGLIEPRWLEQAPEFLRGDALVSRWMECLKSNPRGSIYLHPHILLSSHSKGDDVPILHAWGESGRIDYLAALAAKTMRLKLLPGIPLAFSLRGWRLVGDQILGKGNPVGLKDFLREIAEFVASGHGDCMLFEDVEVGSPLWNTLSEIGQGRNKVSMFYPWRPQAHQWIRFPEKPEEYWNHFSSKTRNTLRRHAKKLEHTLVCYRDPESVPALLEKAHHISKRSWQGKRLGLRITNSAKQQSFWSMIAACGGLRSFTLERHGEPLAFLLGIQYGSCFEYVETAYDTDYARYSPGTVLLYRVLEALIASDSPSLLDFSFGDGEHKRMFANYQTETGPVLMVRRSFRPMALMRSHQLQASLSSMLRAGVKKFRLSWLRRIYRK